MTQINDIRKAFYEEGMNISQIAKTYGVDRKTIRRYVNKTDWNQPIAVTAVNDFPKLTPYKEKIDCWLEDDKKARKKQRHTAKRVYDRLVEEYGEQFNCSYRTVAAYVAMKKKELFQTNTCKIPLEHPPGEAQVDFGQADFYENGTLYNGAYLNVSFPYSNAGYAQLFKGENQECLLEGLKTIFEHIGGVPQRLWFDNTSTIVTKILKEGERKLSGSFLRFKQHYGFETNFCNPESGHEKGSVESKVGYHRRNFLVPVPSFESLDEFNRKLLQECDLDMQREHYRYNSTIAKLFAEDQNALFSLPLVSYDVCQYITVRTNAYAKFSLNNGLHTYSTAPMYAYGSVLVKITAYEVIPLDANQRQIVRHHRLYGGTKQESMDWIPYLTQLARRPGALKYSGIYSMLPDPLKNYLDGCKKSERGKVLAGIARLSDKSSFERVVDSVSEALLYGVSDLDSLIAVHNHLTGFIPDIAPVHLPQEIPALTPWEPDINKYDAILRKKGGRPC